MNKFKIAALCALMTATQMTWASPIFYEVENLGGTTWQYTYHVGNDTAGPIDLFSIFFDIDLYSFDLISGPTGFEVDPAVYAGPADWDVSVAPPDPFFPGPADDQPGIFNGVALAAPVNPGDLLSDFTIVFDWLGPGAPGSQPFTLFGTDLLPVFDDNFFTQPLPVVSVSEPHFVLPGFFLLLLAVWRQRNLHA
ncbi:MAG: hypothetical protein HKN70_11730 [Gammaproteobacteria bacterium]|nr:hypothetical protein [Gammaproteobacteria bacterium]